MSEPTLPTSADALASWPTSAAVPVEPDRAPEPPDYFAADTYDDAAHGQGERRSQSQATELIALAREQFEVIRGEDGRTYAVPRTSAGLALPLRGKPGMRERVAATFFDQRGRAATGQALSDMLTTLEGDALKADPVAVHLRVAQADDRVYVHLGHAESARAVEVSPAGVRIIEHPPVMFRRSPLGLPLALPAAVGSLEPLAALLNVSRTGLRLVVGWILAAYLPAMPHPILALLGQQGTAKTTAMRMILSLIDPSPAPTRSVPRDEDSWATPAVHSWAIGLDNVSNLAPWFQDALCKAVTGDGLVRRAKYSDDDVSVLTFRRVIALTSIDPGALQGDVADRLLPVDLEPIGPRSRRTQAEVDAAFSAAAPTILAALFDLLSKVLGVLPAVELDEKPRMADFARLLAALDEVTGWSTLADYLAATSETAENVVEGSAFVTAVRALVKSRRYWEGTAEQLLDDVTPERPPRNWPGTPRAVAGLLGRYTPALGQVGITVTKRPRGRGGVRGFVLSDAAIPGCQACGQPLDETLAALGESVHPTCAATPARDGGRAS